MQAAPVFRVLGTLQADRDGSPLPLPSRRQRAVLAALLTRAGRPVPADELIEAAWGERLPDHPKDALQTVLSRLRTTLGAELITAEISGYRLNVTADDVDALRFAALRGRAGHPGGAGLRPASARPGGEVRARPRADLAGPAGPDSPQRAARGTSAL